MTLKYVYKYTCFFVEFTKSIEAMKSDSPKAKEEADVVTATVKPSKSKGTGNGTKNIKTSLLILTRINLLLVTVLTQHNRQNHQPQQ